MSVFLAGPAAAGTGSGRTEGDELRADAHKPLEAFAFLAPGAAQCPCASPSVAASRAGELDLAAARVEGFGREDGAPEVAGAAGLGLSADRALLHVAEPPAADARPGLGDAHHLPAGGVAGGATGLNLEGASLLRPAGTAAALFFSDGTSGGRRCSPSAAAAAAAAAFLRSTFTMASMKKKRKNSRARREVPPTSARLSSSYRATPDAPPPPPRRGDAKPRGSTTTTRHDPTTGIVSRGRSLH